MKRFKFFCLFFFLPGVAFALDLSQHGPDLMKAAFPIRYKFEQTYHEEWVKSSYDERKAFLISWYKEEAADAKKAMIQAKKDVALQQEIEKADKVEKKRLDNIKKAREKEAKEEHKETVNDKRDFDRAIAEKDRELKKLQMEALRKHN
jgi:hypothetical protein